MRVALAALYALMLAVPVAAAAPFTLRDAVDEVLARNPHALAAEARQHAAAAHVAAARSAWLPTVDISAASTRSDDPAFVFAALLQQGGFGARHFDPAFLNAPPVIRSDRASLNVRYALFDQLRRVGSVTAARNDLQSAGSAGEETRQRLRSETIARFYGIAVAIARRDTAGEAVRTGEAQARAIGDKLREGLVVEADVLATEVQVASFRQQQIEADGDLTIARAALATLLQRPLIEQIVTDTTLPERDVALPTLDDAIARGIRSRGEIRSAALAARNSDIDLRTARGALLPRLDAFASWSATGRTLSSTNPDHALAILASVPLFDAARYARVAAARAGAIESAATAAATRDRVTMEIVSAHTRVTSARERLHVASKAAEQASAATRIVRDRYDNGLTTVTEQLRAETALVSARLAVLAARYDFLTGYAELLRVTGDLHDLEPFV